MEFQILLLPHDNYWDWVRASRAYVLRFGANLTPDPGTAVRYMAPTQVITFPKFSHAFPAVGDIEGWLQEQDPEIRLDPIDAHEPDAFQDVLQTRIDSGDRYGQRQRPFYLLWPTEYPVITQPFGANPQIYTRFGMPGHEGLDIRALTNTNVYACADGVVYRVHKQPKTHAYGIHIRIRHAYGYRTVYGHLAQALVREGDEVKAGMVIGKANSTGASTAAHLHLTLKQDGASLRKETIYPKDVIDPTPFLVWPEGSGRRHTARSAPIAGKCLLGAFGRLGGNLRDEDLRLVELARLEALMLTLTETKESIDRLRALRPGIFLVGRLSAELGGELVTVDRFLERVQPDLDRLYHLGIRSFEVLSAPNLQTEGWRRSWSDGASFAHWYLDLIARLREHYPEAQLGFPGLSPGESLSGWREDTLRFLEAADDAVEASDWVGVHCYWTSEVQFRSALHGRLYETYRTRYPSKELVITEFGNPSVGLRSVGRARQYLEFYRQIRTSAQIKAAFCVALSAQSGFESLVWDQDLDSSDNIARILGRRAF